MSKKHKKEVRSKKKEKKGRGKEDNFRSNILALLDDPKGRALTFKQLIKKLGVKKKEDIKKVGQFLDELAGNDRIKQLDNGGYTTSRSLEEFEESLTT
jgi:ribonuclease R